MCGYSGIRSFEPQVQCRDMINKAYGQLSLFSKKKLPWVGFELTTLCVLGERSTNSATRAAQLAELKCTCIYIHVSVHVLVYRAIPFPVRV